VKSFLHRKPEPSTLACVFNNMSSYTFGESRMSQFNRAGRAMPPLPVPTRWLILAICLLQGFLLYYFFSDHAAIRYAGFSHNIYGQTMA